jgi:hypothetical protein
MVGRRRWATCRPVRFWTVERCCSPLHELGMLQTFRASTVASHSVIAATRQSRSRQPFAWKTPVVTPGCFADAAAGDTTNEPAPSSFHRRKRSRPSSRPARPRVAVRRARAPLRRPACWRDHPLPQSDTKRGGGGGGETAPARKFLSRKNFPYVHYDDPWFADKALRRQSRDEDLTPGTEVGGLFNTKNDMRRGRLRGPFL